MPNELVDIVKLYTGEGLWRGGKYITIHKISKDDFRYFMLSGRSVPSFEICYFSDSVSTQSEVFLKSVNNKKCRIVIRRIQSKGSSLIFYLFEFYCGNRVVLHDIR